MNNKLNVNLQLIKNNCMKRLLLQFAFGILACLVNLDVQAETSSRFGDEIQLSTDVIKFGKDLGPKEVKILKGKNFMLYSGSDWIKCDLTKNGTLLISAKPYNNYYPRRSSIILTSKKTNYSKVLSIVQTDGSDRPEFIRKAVGDNLCFLTDMDLTNMTFSYIKEIQKNKSADGRPMMLKAIRYEEGIATHAPSTMLFRLNGAKRFIADLAIDDEVAEHNSDYFGNVGFILELDGKVVKKGKLKVFDNKIESLNIDLKGAKEMKLQFTEEGSNYGDHVDLGNARFEYEGEKPVTLKVEENK